MGWKVEGVRKSDFDGALWMKRYSGEPRRHTGRGGWQEIRMAFVPGSFYWMGTKTALVLHGFGQERNFLAF